MVSFTSLTNVALLSTFSLILDPEGTSVLKELLQNADDACATKLCICFDQRDQRSTPPGSFLYPGLAAFAGPAVTCFNDAMFTEADFVSITRIGDSGKQKAN